MKLSKIDLFHMRSRSPSRADEGTATVQVQALAVLLIVLSGRICGAVCSVLHSARRGFAPQIDCLMDCATGGFVAKEYLKTLSSIVHSLSVSVSVCAAAGEYLHAHPPSK